ncbi:sugar kinase [Lonepinella koalarum]|uniref:sugar kinase n=1 Tax=Lonepinella koalarum TaxID=53417 RepID=UPI003F6E1F57
MKIAVIGECMIELAQQDQQVKLGFGGDTLNTAIYLARLLPNSFSVHYITALGVDPYSQKMLAQWQQEQINTELVQCLPDKLPGLYSIITNEQGERSFYYWRSDSAAKYWLKSPNAEQILSKLKQFDYIYLSGISLAILDNVSRQKLFHFLPRFKQGGGKIIFDNNYRPILWENKETTQQIYRQILSFTDIAFLTFDDEQQLWQDKTLADCIMRTQQFGVTEIVIKRGAEDCIVQTQQQFSIPAIKVENVIDTTAAGDSFSAGYLAARLQQKNEIQSAQQGHVVASKVISYRGAIIPKEIF